MSGGGGPAFPFTFEELVADGPEVPAQMAGVRRVPRQFRGMTLRDYFAAQALVGLHVVVAARADEIEDALGGIDGESADAIHSEIDNGLAGHAYRLADAMLKAREGTP